MGEWRGLLVLIGELVSPFPFPGDSRGTVERGDNGAQELRRMGNRTLEWIAGRQ